MLVNKVVYVFFLILPNFLMASESEKEEIDIIKERLTAVEESLEALQPIMSVIDVMEALDSLTSSLSTSVIPESDELSKDNYDFFDVEIFDKRNEEGYIYKRLSWEIKITATRIPRSIRAAKGAIVFFDLFDEEKMRIPFTLTDTLIDGQSIVLAERMARSADSSGFSWFASTDIDDMKVVFDVIEVLFLENAPELNRKTLSDKIGSEITNYDELSLEGGIKLLKESVQRNWIRPQSAKNGMFARIKIRILPNGNLRDAVVIQSSGNPDFDRSAEKAVYAAFPRPEFQKMPLDVFSSNFRSFTLYFNSTEM